MLDLTRRDLFVGVTASAAATLAPRVAKADVPPVKSTGIFSYKVGDCEIIQLRDGARTKRRRGRRSRRPLRPPTSTSRPASAKPERTQSKSSPRRV